MSYFFVLLVKKILIIQQKGIPPIPDITIHKLVLSTPVKICVNTMSPKSTWPALSKIFAKRINSSALKNGFFLRKITGIVLPFLPDVLHSKGEISLHFLVGIEDSFWIKNLFRLFKQFQDLFIILQMKIGSSYPAIIVFTAG